MAADTESGITVSKFEIVRRIATILTGTIIIWSARLTVICLLVQSLPPLGPLWPLINKIKLAPEVSIPPLVIQLPYYSPRYPLSPVSSEPLL